MLELQRGKMEFLNTKKLDPKKFLFPETSATSLPINAIISDYYFKEGKDSIGLELLWDSKKFNPFISFNDYMLSKYYYINKNLDSLKYYSKKAYLNMPNNKAHIIFYMRSAGENKDLELLDSIYDKINSKNSDDIDINEIYLAQRINIRRDEQTKILSKKLLNKYPQNFRFKTLFKLANLEKKDIDRARYYFDIGKEFFLRKEIDSSISNFEKSIKLDSLEYSYVETLAGALIYNNQNREGLLKLKKVISQFSANDGKAEYLMGMAYLGEKIIDSSCYYFKISNQKKYNLAKFRLEENCN